MKSLKLLADENFPWKAVKAFRLAGHDVAWITKDKPGSSDHEVLSRAVKEKRILLTFDHDFSQLAFHAGFSAEIGIILFAIAPDSPDRIAEKAMQILESRDDWAGHFSTIEENRIRMISLQQKKSL